MEFVRNNKHFSKYYDGIYILFYTGMRISKFVGLTVKDIDLRERTLNTYTHVDFDNVKKEVKSLDKAVL